MRPMAQGYCQCGGPWMRAGQRVAEQVKRARVRAQHVVPIRGKVGTGVSRSYADDMSTIIMAVFVATKRKPSSGRRTTVVDCRMRNTAGAVRFSARNLLETSLQLVRGIGEEHSIVAMPVSTSQNASMCHTEPRGCSMMIWQALVNGADHCPPETMDG